MLETKYFRWKFDSVVFLGSSVQVFIWVSGEPPVSLWGASGEPPGSFRGASGSLRGAAGSLRGASTSLQGASRSLRGASGRHQRGKCVSS